jgi:ABC-type sugar transport system substrate-binding protein
MVTGELPFDSDTGDVVSIIYQHLEKLPARPSSINADVPPGVDAVILRALNKDANLRYSSVMDMVHDLEAVLGYRPSTGDLTATPNMFPVVQPRQRRLNRSAVVGAVVVLAAIVLIAGVLIFSNRGPATFKPTILVDTERSAQTLVPDSDTIARAQRALGDRFIAYITCNQTSEYHATQAREMGDFAQAYGLNYEIFDSNNNEYGQITQLERARAAGAGAFIVCPLSPDLLADALQSLDDADYPLVILSSDFASYGGVMVTGDEYLMGFKPGQLAGQIIAEEMDGEARVIILDYPDLPTLIRRADGLEEGVLSAAPNATIVGRYLGAVPDFAQESVAKLLNDGVEFDVIVSINDAGSFGAIEALEEAGIPSDDVVITSVDAERLARRYIEEGHYMRGSVVVGREEFSHAAIDAVIQLLAGGTLPERILVPPGDVITAANLADSE